jgi:formylglycine-generating enzyme required for sulfatase activity
MEFLWIPAMDCWVGRFEVTLGEYRWQNPDHQNKPFRHLPMDDPRQPAVSLNFQEMCDYAAWLTDREAALGRIPEGWWFRLPTRREAIDFTLAGRDSDFPWGAAWPPPTGNFADSAFHQEFPDLPFIPDCRDANPVSAPVEESGENDWGLYGTCGNVWETCVADATAAKFGGWHGGAFDDARPERCGAKSFYGYLGTARGALNGFRLLLVPRPTPPDPAP